MIASTSLLSSAFLKSFNGVAASPISFCVAPANLFKIVSSTSHTCVIRAAFSFAFSDDKCAYAREFSPITAKFSRSFAPAIRA